MQTKKVKNTKSQKKVLTAHRLARLSVKRRSGRNIKLSLLVGVLALILFCTSYLNTALGRGIESMSDRLGADVLVVPAGYDSNLKGAILRGEPSEFYLPYEYIEEVQSLPGVEQASPQLFIMSLSASCCSLPVQLIGFEQDTDFNVRSWLRRLDIDNMSDNQVIVGDYINSTVGDKLKFFNHEFEIVGKLESTGTGFDSSVFMTMEAAQSILRHDFFVKEISEKAQAQQQIDPTKTKAVSTILVKKTSGTDSGELARSINEHFRGRQVYGLTTQNLLGEVATKFQSLKIFSVTTSVLLWLLSCLVLHFAFAAMFKEREKEFSMLLVLGSGKNYVRRLILIETILICLRGSLIGVSIGFFFCYFFNNLLSTIWALPWIQIPLWGGLSIALATLLLSTITGPLAGIGFCRQLLRGEPYLALNRQD